MKIWSFPFLLAGCVALAGCSADSRRPDARFVVDTLESGRVQVTNDGLGVWTPETAWTLEEDLRLGTIDGGGPEQFSQVAWIVEDDEGRIFILDYQEQEIRVFSSSGAYSHSIGRSGRGPGELSGAAGLHWAPDGSLWVWGFDRYSVFNASGAFVTSFPRHVRGVIYPFNGGFTADGRYFDWGLHREDGPDPNAVVGPVTFYPIHFEPPERFDTLPPLRFDLLTTTDGRRKRGANRGIVLAQARSGHIWFAHTHEYTVYERTLEGDTLLAFSIPSRPATIPVSEIDSLIRLYREQGFPTQLDSDEFVDERRLVTRVLVDDAGHVYVLPAEEGVAQGTVIDVFEESGVYLGRMEFGATVLTMGPPPYVTPEHIYAVVNDEYDVPFVVRWRIVRP